MTEEERRKFLSNKKIIITIVLILSLVVVGVFFLKSRRFQSKKKGQIHKEQDEKMPNPLTYNSVTNSLTQYFDINSSPTSSGEERYTAKHAQTFSELSLIGTKSNIRYAQLSTYILDTSTYEIKSMVASIIKQYLTNIFEDNYDTANNFLQECLTKGEGKSIKIRDLTLEIAFSQSKYFKGFTAIKVKKEI